MVNTGQLLFPQNAARATTLANHNSRHSKQTIQPCAVADLFVMEQWYHPFRPEFDKSRNHLNTIITTAAGIHTLTAYTTI